MQGEPNILVGKIVATPSPTSWAQAYNAGKLFAVISLSNDSEENEKDFLNILGKDTIEALEQEYYTLEEKNLISIKAAFANAVNKIPENIEFSFAAAAVIKDIIYILYSGSVRINIKRGEDFAVLIDSEDKRDPQAISGKIKDGDLLIIQTKEFKNLISTSALGAYVKSGGPDEIAEAIAPTVHKDENSGAAAIIINCNFEKEAIAPTEDMVEDKEEVSSQIEMKEKKLSLLPILSIFKFIKIPSMRGIPHTRKLILTIAILIAIILAVAIFFTIQKQNEEKLNTLFESVYTSAEEKYIEAEGLSDLNKILAGEGFEQAYKILNDNKDKFPKGSEQEKKVLELLERVEEKMDENSPEKIVERQDRERISLTIENGSGAEGAAGKASDLLKGKGYNVTKTQNADNYDYEGATIRVKNSLNVYLDLLEEDISEEYEVTDKKTDLPEDSSVDAVITIGK